MSGARNHARWRKNFDRLAGYAKETGHSLVPRSFIADDGFKLGIWVAEQRRRHLCHAPVELALLEALPGWVWNATAWRDTRG